MDSWNFGMYSINRQRRAWMLISIQKWWHATGVVSIIIYWRLAAATVSSKAGTFEICRRQCLNSMDALMLCDAFDFHRLMQMSSLLFLMIFHHEFGTSTKALKPSRQSIIIRNLIMAWIGIVWSKINWPIVAGIHSFTFTVHARWPLNENLSRRLATACAYLPVDCDISLDRFSLWFSKMNFFYLS